MGTQPSFFGAARPCEVEPCAQRPVERVSWFDALAYLNARSQAEGLSPCYSLERCTRQPGGGCEDPQAESCLLGFICQSVAWERGCTGYRLPTEAEWEAAARAGGLEEAQAPEPLADFAWYLSNARDRSHAAGAAQPNGLGLYDTLGNVAEWVWDRYEPEYGFFGKPERPVPDPAGPDYGEVRVIKGCGHRSGPDLCRLGDRETQAPAHHARDLGFRPVRSL